MSNPVESFLTSFAPFAQAAGAQLGVDPATIMAKAALETNWGRSTAGANNYFNVKATGWSGSKGAPVRDNQTGSVDQYRAYDTPEQGVNDYVQLMKRNYPGAVGTGGDVQAFAKGLRHGRIGSFAEDPNYDQKLSSVRAVVAQKLGALGASQPGGAQALTVDDLLTPSGEAASAPRANAQRSPIPTQLTVNDLLGEAQITPPKPAQSGAASGDDAIINELLKTPFGKQLMGEGGLSPEMKQGIRGALAESRNARLNPNSVDAVDFGGDQNAYRSALLQQRLNALAMQNRDAQKPLLARVIDRAGDAGDVLGGGIGRGAARKLAAMPLSLAANLVMGFQSTGGAVNQVLGRAVGSKELEQSGQTGRAKARGLINAVRPEFESRGARGLWSGAESFAQQSPGMAASLATGNPLPAMVAIGLQSGAEGAASALDAGYDLPSALNVGAMKAIAEVLPERLQVGTLLKDVASRAGMAKMTAKQLAAEQAGEQISTHTGDLIEYAYGLDGKTKGDLAGYVASRGDSAIDTVLASTSMAGLNSATGQMAGAIQDRRQLASASQVPATGNLKVDLAALNAAPVTPVKGADEIGGDLAALLRQTSERVQSTLEGEQRAQVGVVAAPPVAANDVIASLLPAMPAGFTAPPRAEIGAAPVMAGQQVGFDQLVTPTAATPDISGALADADARVAAAEQQRSQQARRQILDAVLADPGIRNPGPAFAAELQRQGYRDAAPSPDEQSLLARFEAARAAFHDAPDLSIVPTSPHDTTRDWRAERDAELYGADAPVSQTPAQASTVPKPRQEQARPAAALPSELAQLADQSKTAMHFYQAAKKAGVPNITQEDTRRQLMAAFRAHKAATPKAPVVAQPPAAVPQNSAMVAPATPTVAPSAPKAKSWHQAASTVQVERDSVRDAIARLGGLNKEQAMREWGATLVEGVHSRVFGKPLFRRKGGLPLDKMREALGELGYLPMESDVNALYDAFADNHNHPLRDEAQAAERAAQQTPPADPGATSTDELRDPFDASTAHDALLDGPAAFLPDEAHEQAEREAEHLTPEGIEAMQALVEELRQKHGDDADAILERIAMQTAEGDITDTIKALERVLNEQGDRQTESTPAERTAKSARSGVSHSQGGQESFLESYDQQELDRREVSQRAAEAQRQAEERQAEQKRQADSERDSFTLSGSDRESDQLAARGQGGLFDLPPSHTETTAPSRPERLKNYGWDSVKLAENYSFDELNRLREQVQAEHANPKNEAGRYIEGGRPTIYLYDKVGRKKLDKLAMAVYHKQKDATTERAPEIEYGADLARDAAQYSRGDDFPAGMTKNALQVAVTSALAKWKGAPGIHLHQSIAELGYDPAEFGDVEGVYFPATGEVHLFADAIRTPGRALEVLAHEAVGHASLEGLLGPELTARLVKNVRLMEVAGNKAVLEAAAIVDERQPMLSATRRAKEIVALMAERGQHLRSNLGERIVAAVRYWLRRAGFSNQWLNTLNEQDIYRLLRQAERRLETGEGGKAAVPLLSDEGFNEAVFSALAARGIQFSRKKGQGNEEERENSAAANSRQPHAPGEPVVQPQSRGLYLPKEEAGAGLKQTVDAGDAGVNDGATDGVQFGQRAGLFLLPPIEAVELTGLELGENLSKKQLAKAADALLRDIQHSGVPLHNQDTDWGLAVSKDGRSKMGDNPDLSATDSKAVAAIRDLVERAVLAESHADMKHGNSTVKAVHRLYAPALIEGRPYRVKLTVKDYALTDGSQRKNLHALEAVEIENAPMGTVPSANPAKTPAESWIAQPTSGRTFTISELLAGAKREGDGMLFTDDKAMPGDALFSAREWTEPPAAEAQAKPEPKAGEIAPETTTQHHVRTQVNKMGRVENVEAQLEQMGISIPDWLSPSAAEVAFHGRRAERLADFKEKDVANLAEAMAKSGITPERLDWYLLARHAEERNQQVAKVNPDLPDGGSGMSTAQANALLAGKPVQMRVEVADEHGRVTQEQVDVAGFSADELGGLGEVASHVDAMIAKTRDLMRSYSLEDLSAISAWEKAYQHYVPLSGKAGVGEFGGAPGKDTGFSVRGGARRALGRTSVAPNITEQVIRSVEDTIQRGETNRVAGAVAAMAAKLEADGSMPLAPNGKPLLEVNPTEVRRYFRNGKIVKAEMPDAVGRDIAIARIDGKDVPVRINDEALAEALRNLDAPQMSALLSFISKGTKFMSMTFTGANPTFWPVAAMRDAVTVVVQGQRYGEKIASGTLKALPKAMVEAFRYEMTGRENQQHRAFRLNGGRTGYIQSERNLEQKRANLLDAIQSAGPLNASTAPAKVKRVLRALWHYYLSIGGALESGMRYAAFQSASQQLNDVQKAARIAKEITLNFNRKGQGETAQMMAALFPFYNAALQGTRSELMAMSSKRVAVATAVFGGIVALSQIALMASLGDDDRDKLLNNPTFQTDRMRNILIPTGDKERPYVRIPLVAPGLMSLVTGAGIATSEMVMGEKGSTWRALAAIGMGASELAPPPVSDMTRAYVSARPQDRGAAVAVAAVPGVIKPVAQSAFNVNYLGQQIVPESKFANDEANPDSYKALRRNRTGWASDLAVALNSATGGNVATKGTIDVSPETIMHFVRAYTGGIGSTIIQGSDAISNPQKGMLDLPIVNRFTANPDAIERGETGRAYDVIDRVTTQVDRYKKLVQAGDVKAAEQVRHELEASGDAGLVTVVNVTERMLTRLGRAENRLGVREDAESMRQRSDLAARRQQAFTRLMNAERQRQATQPQ